MHEFYHVYIKRGIKFRPFPLALTVAVIALCLLCLSLCSVSSVKAALVQFFNLALNPL